ncbi:MULTISPECIES: type II secretion system protein [unclassified Nodularia (in: cyanobacteria)]|uniref:pilus assembly FimT family protein n=1 Tax=unclassified Nodularia (in: cyanobacteria) TaxID=2656917 RepID=UPI0018806521|nr:MULTISPECIES: type II secretion system protein [unclassified Nodularia (in: cyanobacteria)]MBE9201547.1 type II secretion system protein [Nodularia sp. LEGE 06071]MCC2695920.1 type II secretion system protein [Nodularia sp. LEGE 04288]
MKVYRNSSNYLQTIKYFYANLNNGFTLLETLSVVLMIGTLSAIAAPTWLSFVQTQRLNTSQGQVYRAMRQAQSQAKKERLTWQASFREQNSIVQWAVHPGTVNPSDANWNDLNSNVCLDPETTLQESNGVRRIQFDYRGNVRQPPLGRITLSTKCGGKVKRCVIVSTILGAMRTAKEQSKMQDDKYCY